MRVLPHTSGVVLSIAALSLAGLSVAAAHVSNDGCVPPGLFEPTGLIEPVSEPAVETPTADADFSHTV